VRGGWFRETFLDASLKASRPAATTVIKGEPTRRTPTHWIVPFDDGPQLKRRPPCLLSFLIRCF
jgi:hypothetical protein